MAPLPVELLLGVYLGLLTGLFPALVSWAMAFVVRYLTGIQLPGFGVVVLALALAGVQGGLLAFSNDEFLTTVGGSPVPIGTAILVILMMSFYAHAKGDAMGTTFPKRFSLRGLRERSLSADVVELVGGRAEVRVTVTGDVDDIEGYPALAADLRESVRAIEYTFSADIPLDELERRVADRLRTEFDLAEVAVSLDERGRATVAAAPPMSGLSKRVPAGKRAVSLAALVPTGLARGDVVDLHLPDGVVSGTVVSAKSGLARPARATPAPPAPSAAVDNDPADDDRGPPLTDGGEEAPKPERAPTTAGGDGRLTVAVDRADARRLLTADYPWVVVCSRGHHREYELLSLLRRAGKRLRRLEVGDDGAAGRTLSEMKVREEYGVAVLAVRHADSWRFAPRGRTALSAGDELFVAGTRDDIERFAEVVA